MLPVLCCVFLREAGQWAGRHQLVQSSLVFCTAISFMQMAIHYFYLAFTFQPSTTISPSTLSSGIFFSSFFLLSLDKTQVSLPSFLHGKHWVPSSHLLLSLTLLRAQFFSLYLVFGFEKRLTVCLRVEHSRATWLLCMPVTAMLNNYC